MNIISHSSKINLLSESPLKDHIQARINSPSLDTDIPPAIFLIGKQDLPTGPEFSFLGSAGMCSDLFETHQPGESEFASVFEWVSYLPDLKVYEMLYLEADLGYLLM